MLCRYGLTVSAHTDQSNQILALKKHELNKAADETRTSVNCIQVFSLFTHVHTVQRFAVRSANCSTDGEASGDSERSPPSATLVGTGDYAGRK